ncbi:MAG: coproporphyrinogen dehydrogenase HemZ [Oscillospiraceae bacterium]|nr:coproporphyrinogen dehydrogenase HemZ [Oscillospiraceae bacterium]
MILHIVGHDFHYEMENLCRVFFPDEQIRVVKYNSFTDVDRESINLRANTFAKSDGKTVVAALKCCGNTVEIFAEAVIDGTTKRAEKNISSEVPDLNSECERILAVTLFEVLSGLTDYVPPWGVLTGVRPSKLMHTLISDLGEEGARDYFLGKLLVREDKTRLTLDVAKRERSVIGLSRPDSFSLYAAIPFCPSRCAYCSFVSHSITGPGAKKLVPKYVNLLAEELEVTGKIVRELGLNLESVYFGGGTPTVLEAEDLRFLCETVRKNFNIRSCREYTVEAGRPDTVTREKLEVLRDYGVTRVSINPQTFGDGVLKSIGRDHTAQDAIYKYRLAREVGFDSVNMDLIAGLDSDTLAGFRESVCKVVDLYPENITVHALALKRSSSLVSQGISRFNGGEAVSEMLNCVQSILPLQGYAPYYMYRQSRCVGNFENVGWCLPEKECLYNIFMMEECHTVLAAGAGAVTKLRRPDGYIERIFNFKYPYEYISRFDQLMARKERIISFYNS